MEATQATLQPAVREDLIRELDGLSEKVELAATLIGELRRERSDLRGQCEALRRERQRLFDAAAVHDAAELLRALDHLKELEREHQALLEERSEVARRLGKLAEKVDLLDRDS